MWFQQVQSNDWLSEHWQLWAWKNSGPGYLVHACRFWWRHSSWSTSRLSWWHRRSQFFLSGLRVVIPTMFQFNIVLLNPICLTWLKWPIYMWFTCLNLFIMVIFQGNGLPEGKSKLDGDGPTLFNITLYLGRWASMCYFDLFWGSPGCLVFLACTQKRGSSCSSMIRIMLAIHLTLMLLSTSKHRNDPFTKKWILTGSGPMDPTACCSRSDFVFLPRVTQDPLYYLQGDPMVGFGSLEKSRIPVPYVSFRYSRVLNHLKPT